MPSAPFFIQMHLLQSIRRHVMQLLFLLVLLVLLLFAAQLFQDRLIYFPRSYTLAPDALPPPLQLIAYETASGRHFAFYLPPRANQPQQAHTRSDQPRRIWFVFGGNATLALEWRSWLQATLADNDAALLFDYPGFGFNAGRPGTTAILDSSNAAFSALASHLHLAVPELQQRLAVLGHSIGAAAALQFAQRHPPRQLVLLAPFTSLRAEAQAVYGAWVGPFVRNDFDNVAALKQLNPRHTSVHVLHGRDDNIVPARFSRELAAMFPWLHYTEIEKAGHNDLLERADTALQDLLRGETSAR